MPARTTWALALLILAGAARASETFPWTRESGCEFKPRDGIYPSALAALSTVGLERRITNGLNLRAGRSNYHGPDNGESNPPYTAAVDLSTRCLTPQSDSSIRTMLSKLADLGFAAWYRQNGYDGWRGSAHIHAIFVGEPMKPQLRRQVRAWLEGNTGLAAHPGPYGFWEPTPEQREYIRATFKQANP